MKCQQTVVSTHAKGMLAHLKRDGACSQLSLFRNSSTACRHAITARRGDCSDRQVHATAARRLACTVHELANGMQLQHVLPFNKPLESRPCLYSFANNTLQKKKKKKKNKKKVMGRADRRY